jgi:hypothetical protein
VFSDQNEIRGEGVWWSDGKNVDSVKTLPNHDRKRGGREKTGERRTEMSKFGKVDRGFTENKERGGYLPKKEKHYRIGEYFTESENGLPNLKQYYKLRGVFTESEIYRIGTKKKARFG